MSRLKKEFLRTIEPHLKVAQEAASSFGIPFFATVQTAPQEFHGYCANEEKSNSSKFTMMRYINETSTIDDFLELIIIDAQKNGHDSAYLEAMGIPRKPSGTQEALRRIKSLTDGMSEIQSPEGDY